MSVFSGSGPPLNRDAARANLGAVVVIASFGSATISWAGADPNDRTMFDIATPTRLICRVAGRYKVSLLAFYGTSPTQRGLAATTLRLNGVTALAVWHGDVSDDATKSQHWEAWADLVVGDYLEINVFNANSADSLTWGSVGASLCNFFMQRVSD